MTTTYYVKAVPNGAFAACSYFTDSSGQHPVAGNTLVVPPTAPACLIAEAKSSELELLGASYQTLGDPAVMTENNFSPAEGGVVSVSMPTTEVVSKGVVLIFSNPGTVTALYPSSDPVVTNGEQ